MNIIRSYIVQSLVLLFSLVLFYIYIVIDELGENVFFAPIVTIVLVAIIFEFILIPINIFYIKILEHIKLNKIIIRTNKSIIIFSIIFDTIYFLNISLFRFYELEQLVFQYSLLSIGIVILNIFVFVKKSTN